MSVLNIFFLTLIARGIQIIISEGGHIWPAQPILLKSRMIGFCLYGQLTVFLNPKYWVIILSELKVTEGKL